MNNKFLIDVVPKRKTINIRGEKFGTQETFGLQLDVSKQTQADITNIIAGITIAEAEQQERLGNDVSRQLIDGRATKPLLSVQRRSVLWFGNEFDQALIRAIERSLRQSIKRFMPTRIKAGEARWLRQWGWPGVSDIQSNWMWLYRAEDESSFTRMPRSKLKDLVMPPGSKLILKPRSGSGIALGYLNHYAKTQGLKVTARRGANKGRTRTDRQHGFMAHSIMTLKRSRWARNYSIYVTNTERYMTQADRKAKEENLWSYGTPYINIVARMRTKRTGTYARYRKPTEYRR